MTAHTSSPAVPQDQDERFMRVALGLAQQAEAQGEVPVGAVVVHDGEVIGKGWNQTITSSDPTAHAELQALRDAGANLGNYRLRGCDLYVTLEPCPMCAGALVHARLRRLVFGAFDPKTGAAGSVFSLLPGNRHNHRVEVHGGCLEADCGSQLRAFFRARR